MRKKVFVKIAFMLIGLLVISVSVSAQHQVALQQPNTIPNYCQEQNTWCGAAVGQMIMQGYPNSEHPYTQTQVWNNIQSHMNPLNDPNVNWATCPDELRNSLMDIGSEPGVYWSVFAKSVEQDLMYDIAYWMTKVRYPVATLVWGFAHWVTVVEITTDVNPVTNSNINLQSIRIFNPWNPPCPTASAGGVDVFMTGTNWYSNYWTPDSSTASKWHGNYIAVIEPPMNEGRADAPGEPEEGKVISEKEAQEAAAMWIEKFSLHEKYPRPVLKENKPFKPLLVNRKHKGYYIVPFGYNQDEEEFSVAAVLINAYSGEFQEAGVFKNAIVKYLPEGDALGIAHKYLRDNISRSQLVFKPKQSKCRFLPVWEFSGETDGAVVYVTNDGVVQNRLTESQPGS